MRYVFSSLTRCWRATTRRWSVTTAGERPIGYRGGHASPLRVPARSGLALGRDRGAATSLVAVLLGGGVLMGAGAIVVDVGQIYVERQELQSGADAAAFTLAKACVRTPSTCATQQSVVSSMANLNATDGHTRVKAICGSAILGLQRCPTAAVEADLTDCVGPPPTSTKYVEVHVVTETAGGHNVLPPSFSEALVGGDAHNGDTIGACARATWGVPGMIAGTAVTMSTCVWQEMTTNGYAPAPPAIASTTFEGAIYVHSSSQASQCPAGNTNSGWQAPGGFGWLEQNGPTVCSSTVDAQGNAHTDPGSNVPPGCINWFNNAIDQRTILWMPVFDAVQGSGSGVIFEVKGVSAFVITGYRLGGSNFRQSMLGGAAHNLCGGNANNDRCIMGYFTTGLMPTSSALVDGVPEYGALTIAMVG